MTTTTELAGNGATAPDQGPVPAPTHAPRDRRSLVLALSIGVAAVFVGVVATLGYTSVTKRVHTLENDLVSINAKLAKAQASTATANKNVEAANKEIDAQARQIQRTGAAQVDAVTKRVDALEVGAKQVRDCLPELQGEINSQSLGTTDVGGYLTSAWITNRLQVSRVCEPLLSPYPPGD